MNMDNKGTVYYEGFSKALTIKINKNAINIQNVDYGFNSYMAVGGINYKINNDIKEIILYAFLNVNSPTNNFFLNHNLGNEIFNYTIYWLNPDGKKIKLHPNFEKNI